MIEIPGSTYRIQFCPQFGFRDALKVVQYLYDLGISHVYASPIFAARSGSTHGYDVVDPNTLNRELGTMQDFSALRTAMRERGMGWIQDIVPNHMAFDSRNGMLMDVLENGKSSPFWNHFDIDWEHPYENLRGKVLAPHLGRFYSVCLEDGEIQLAYGQRGFTVGYYDLSLPLRMDSYVKLLVHNVDNLEKKLDDNVADLRALHDIVTMLSGLSPTLHPKERSEQVAYCKEMLWNLYSRNLIVSSHIDDTVRLFNGQKGNPDSFNQLDELLADQFFRLAFWKVATEEINYRRFFNINQLISVRVEDDRVFRDTHDTILKFLWYGDFDGLRIDHVDGLYDPVAYLKRLRDAGPDAYVLVEKILERGETLRPSWPIQGTSGYDFLIAANGLFVAGHNETRMNAIYEDFVGRSFDFPQLVADKKRLIIGRHMAGDIDGLAHLLKATASRNRYARDITLYALRRALVEILALFPIYRTYTAHAPVDPRDSQYIRGAVRQARTTHPALVLELDFIEKFLLLEFPPNITREEEAQWVQFVMRFQQLTGPLMAKGFEDTVLYNYNRLVSLNDVGGNPDRFGTSVDEFHAFMQERASAWPHTMNTTSTHDTKRGEDVRARISVLSEMPEVWKEKLSFWKEYNHRKKTIGTDGEIPDANDEYLLYQTVLGTFPPGEDEYQEFVERVKAYMIKAVREAKVHTAWIKPDEQYESGTLRFVESILDRSTENVFLNTLRVFQKTITHFGAFNGLAQAMLKMASPGVPDFYQGTELWDLNLVDPDNRRPVDFEKRGACLSELKREQDTNPGGFLRSLLNLKDDGRIKLFTIYRILSARRDHPMLFERGGYIPLEVKGRAQKHIVAFARHYENEWAVAVFPRHLVELISPEQLPCGASVWQDTSIDLPGDAPTRWKNVITDNSIDGNGLLDVASALAEFPVAMLLGDRSRE